MGSLSGILQIMGIILVLPIKIMANIKCWFVVEILTIVLIGVHLIVK
jgi:hypothetical protein